MLSVDVRRLLSVLLLSLGLVLVGAAACEKHADPARTTAMICERVYRVCPVVVPVSPSEAAHCADMFQGRCGAELRQHVQCAVGKCDDAGVIDRLEIERVCLATIEAYRRCQDEDAGDGGGVDEGQLPPFVIDGGTRD